MDESSDTSEDSALVLVPAGAALAQPQLHPAIVYLGRLGPRSRRTMDQALRVAAEILSGGRASWDALPWPALHYSHVAKLRQELDVRYQPASANKILCAVRGVLKEAFRLRLMSGEDFLNAADVKGIRAEVLPAGRALTDGEMRALYASCQKSGHPAAGARDAAVLSLLFGVGLRRSEAVALQVAEYEPETGQLTVRRGKGRKDRLTYATGGGQEALADWLRIRGPAAGALLCPVDRWGRIRLRPMTDQALRQILVRRGQIARVKPFSPHDLRRTYISFLLDAGQDLAIIKGLVGHADIATTQRYDRRGEKEKKRAAGFLHVPYVPPTPPVGV